MQGVGDHPGIPGRIAQCEWCGYFVNSFTDVPLHFCPNCHHGTLREDCPYCHEPIAFPPQLSCLACGKQFTIQKMQEVAGGLGSVNPIEPDAKRRAELEVKGNHWHDVVRGTAEGPDLPPLNVDPPPGWSKEDFDKALRESKVEQGEDLTQAFEEDAEEEEQGAEVGLPDVRLPHIPPFLAHLPQQICEKCNSVYVLGSLEDAMEECPVCHTPMAPPRLDSGTPPS